MTMRTYVITGAALTAAHLLLGPDDAGWVFFVAVSVLATGAMITGIVRHRPRPLTPFVLITLALLCVIGGDVTWVLLAEASGEPPFPSAADAVYLAAYPLGMLALAMLARGPARGARFATLLDAAVIATAAALLSWLYLIRPVFADTTTGSSWPG